MMRMEALACRSYDCKLGKAAMARLGGQSVEKKLTAQRWEIIKKRKQELNQESDQESKKTRT